jgi:uncharacterized membrane protein
MKYKTLRTWQAVIGGLLGVIVAVSVIYNNWIVPVIAIAIALVAITLLKQKVKEIVADERTSAVAGKSARLTLQVTSIGMVILGIIISTVSDGKYSMIGSTLEYSACALLLINMAAYAWYNRKLGGQ